jgi:GDP-fucose protein O-fucosyltransferase
MDLTTNTAMSPRTSPRKRKTKELSGTAESGSFQHVSSQHCRTRRGSRQGHLPLLRFAWVLLLQLISANQKDVLEQQEHHPTSSGNLHPLPQSKRRQQRRRQLDEVHSIAGLDCTDHGGPTLAADEMVYWKDTPRDAHFQSAYANYGPTTKYITFEPDEAGWNNQRMVVEAMVVLALAMGRTLVIPPRARWDYQDLFPLAAIATESRESLNMITMKEFLERQALTGQLIDPTTGQVEFPPENNRTDWNGDLRFIWNGNVLWPYMRRVSYTSRWDRDECVVAIAKEPGPKGVQQLEHYSQQLLADRMHELVRIESYTGRPTPVNATPTQRLREVLAQRKRICIYTDDMQQAKVLHFIGDGSSGKGRVLAHFYVFVWFEDWHLDLWTKRFVRDHLRYADDIQCAAARIVQALRHKAIANGNLQGDFDTFHIRRGDFLGFQPRVDVSALQIYQNTRSVLAPADSSSTTYVRGTLYLSTDEYDRSYFNALREQHFDIYFLDDFKDLFQGMDATHWGMLEQLVASRGRIFVGTYFSTFTGYINRLRGYRSTFTKSHDKKHTYEQQQGIIASYYFAPRDQKYVMRQYRSLSWPMWAREFPIAWRDIDHDVPQVEEE